MKFEADRDGFLRGFPYHDGRIAALAASQDTVRLELRPLSGGARVLSLIGVRHLSINEFREGNIVSTIRQQHTNNCSADLRSIVLHHFGSPPESMPTGLCVFMLECSYGADVVAVCQSVEVSEEG